MSAPWKACPGDPDAAPWHKCGYHHGTEHADAFGGYRCCCGESMVGKKHEASGTPIPMTEIVCSLMEWSVAEDVHMIDTDGVQQVLDRTRRIAAEQNPNNHPLTEILKKLPLLGRSSVEIGLVWHYYDGPLEGSLTWQGDRYWFSALWIPEMDEPMPLENPTYGDLLAIYTLHEDTWYWVDQMEASERGIGMLPTHGLRTPVATLDMRRP